MSHTKEPWVCDSGTGLVGTTASGAFETLAVVQCPRGIPEMSANARRIVACVNACAGIDTDHLEKYGLPDFAQKISDLREQRDELLAALEKSRAVFDSYVKLHRDKTPPDEEKAARNAFHRGVCDEAIASVKKGDAA